MRTILITSAQMTLGRLGFGQLGFSGVVDSNTVASVMRFESARGLPLTGDPFTPATFTRLNSDTDHITNAEQRPSLGLKQFHWTEAWFMAEGPWELEGEPHTYMKANIYCAPNNRAYFGASSTMGECRVWWARLGRGVFSPRELTVLNEHFQIDRWDDVEITSRPRDYPCTRYTLRINRVQQTVTMTRSTLARTGGCSAFEVGDLVTHLGGSANFVPEAPDLGWLELYSLGAEARSALGLKHR